MDLKRIKMNKQMNRLNQKQKINNQIKANKNRMRKNKIIRNMM